MGYTFQLTVDCLSPHELAGWWAQTLGWEVEVDNPQFITSMIQQGLATPTDTMVFNTKLVWKSGAAIFDPAGYGMPRILFQLVPEPKITKNRMHLDVHVGVGELAQTQLDLITRGATYLHSGSQGPHHWITMADPEGNEFCLAEK